MAKHVIATFTIRDGVVVVHVDGKDLGVMRRRRTTPFDGWWFERNRVPLWRLADIDDHQQTALDELERRLGELDKEN